MWGTSCRSNASRAAHAALSQDTPDVSPFRHTPSTQKAATTTFLPSPLNRPYQKHLHVIQTPHSLAAWQTRMHHSLPCSTSLRTAVCHLQTRHSPACLGQAAPPHPPSAWTHSPQYLPAWAASLLGCPC
jgi:hypothetical protein